MWNDSLLFSAKTWPAKSTIIYYSKSRSRKTLMAASNLDPPTTDVFRSFLTSMLTMTNCLLISVISLDFANFFFKAKGKIWPVSYTTVKPAICFATCCKRVETTRLKRVFYRSRWNLSCNKSGIKVVAGWKKLLYKEEISIPLLQRVYLFCALPIISLIKVWFYQWRFLITMATMT